MHKTRYGGVRHRAYHASILAVNAVVSASLLLTLAGQDAVNPGKQQYPDRLPGYRPALHRVAVQSYQDNQSASLNWTLFGQDAVNPGKQRFPDRYPGTAPTQARDAVNTYEEIRPASPLLTLMGQDAMNPGQQNYPDRVPGTRPAQSRLAALSYEDSQSTSQALISGTGSMTSAAGRVTFPDSYPGTRPAQQRVAQNAYEDSQPASGNWTLLGQDFRVPGQQNYPDRVPGYRPSQQRVAQNAPQEVLSSPAVLVLVGQDALNPGQQNAPDRIAGQRATQHRAAITTGEDYPDLLAVLLSAPVPLTPYDQPNPAPKRPNPELRSHALNLGLSTLAGQDAVNPGEQAFPDRLPGSRAALYRAVLSTDEVQPALNVTLLAPTPAPFFPVDQPNPQPKRPNLELRTQTLGLVNGTLRGQDQIASAAGRQPDPDVGALAKARSTRAGQNRAATSEPQDIRPASPLLTLRGQDRFYAGPGQVPTFLWNLPTPRAPYRQHQQGADATLLLALAQSFPSVGKVVVALAAPSINLALASWSVGFAAVPVGSVGIGLAVPGTTLDLAAAGSVVILLEVP